MMFRLKKNLFVGRIYKGIFWLNSSTFLRWEGGNFPQPHTTSHKTNVCEWSSNYMFSIHFDKVIKIWAGLGISLHNSKAKLMHDFQLLYACRSITSGLLYWEIYLTLKWMSEGNVYGGESHKLDFICEGKRGLVQWKARAR